MCGLSLRLGGTVRTVRGVFPGRWTRVRTARCGTGRWTGRNRPEMTSRRLESEGARGRSPKGNPCGGRAMADCWGLRRPEAGLTPGISGLLRNRDVITGLFPSARASLPGNPPEPHGLAGAAGAGSAAIGCEGDGAYGTRCVRASPARDRLSMAFELPDHLAAFKVPEPDRRIALPETNRRPSGVTATLETAPSWPTNRQTPGRFPGPRAGPACRHGRSAPGDRRARGRRRR